MYRMTVFHHIMISLLSFLFLFFSSKNQDIDYLRIGDPAHRLLVKHLHSTTFLNQLNLCTHGVYTEQLEELSSTLRDYIDREENGDTDSYSASVQLAVLEHNENCTRKPVLSE